MNNIALPSKIEQLPASDVAAYWRVYPIAPTIPAAGLLLPLDGFFVNNQFNMSLRRVEAGFLRVAPRARGNGVGERLVRGLGTLAQKYDFPEISVCLASQYSFDIFGRVFGLGRMTPYGQNGGPIDLRVLNGPEPESVEKLDVNPEDVRKTLEDLERAEKDVEDRQHGFKVVVDLDGLDMSDWSLPTEYCLDRENIKSILAN